MVGASTGEPLSQPGSAGFVRLSPAALAPGDDGQYASRWIALALHESREAVVLTCRRGTGFDESNPYEGADSIQPRGFRRRAHRPCALTIILSDSPSFRLSDY